MERPKHEESNIVYHGKGWRLDNLLTRLFEYALSKYTQQKF